MLGRFEDVLDGDQAAELEAVVDDQNPLQPVLVHQRLRELELGALGHGDQAVALGHDVGHRLVEIGLEAQVAVGDDADDFLAVDHRQAGDPVLSRQHQNFAHRHRRRHGYRVLDHAAFEALDLGDLRRLRSRRHVLVHDAQSALLRHRDGEAGFGHGIHRRRQQRDVQRNGLGKAGLEADVAGNDGRMGREQQNVVKSEGFLNDTHNHLFSYAQKRIIRASSCPVNG